MALTDQLLAAVNRGEAGELLRVYRPGPRVAFGRSDRLPPPAPLRRVTSPSGTARPRSCVWPAAMRPPMTAVSWFLS